MKKVWLTMILLFVVLMTIIGIVLFLTYPTQPVVKLAPDNPVVLRSGEQVPLMRFNVTASDTDLALKGIYFNFGFFYDYDADIGAVRAENFTLWNGPNKISQGERLGSRLVLFSPSVVIPSHRRVVITLKSDIAGPDATMQMTLVVLFHDEFRTFRLKQSLEILRP